MSALFATGEYAELGRLLGQLASGGRNLGAEPLARSAEALATVVQDGRWTEVTACLQDLQETLIATFTAITAAPREPSAAPGTSRRRLRRLRRAERATGATCRSSPAGSRAPRARRVVEGDHPESFAASLPAPRGARRRAEPEIGVAACRALREAWGSEPRRDAAAPAVSASWPPIETVRAQPKTRNSNTASSLTGWMRPSTLTAAVAPLLAVPSGTARIEWGLAAEEPQRRATSTPSTLGSISTPTRSGGVRDFPSAWSVGFQRGSRAR
jgi:hypothetical protein